jgi:hypothetical protein
MSFVNPWSIAVGVLAAGLPVLIHWLTRPRPVVMALPTIRFVMQAVNQRRARHRLRDALILAVRAAAVLLIAGAIARPILGRRTPTPVEPAGGTTRVVLLDLSQSMAARAGGIRAIERARPVAANELAYRPRTRAGLVLAAASARPVFDRPTENFGALRDELAKASPRPERLNLPAALDAAARLLAGAPGRHELVILSDFQRTHWAAADFSALPRDTALRLEYVGAPGKAANLAVLRVGGSGRAEQGRPFTVEVDVGNFSDAPRTVEVELSLADASYRLSGPCAAGSKTTLSADVVPRGVGWQAGQAKLFGSTDALAEDDARPFVVDVRPPPAFALLTRQRADARPSSSYYLERALVPAEPRDDRPAPRLTRFHPSGPDREALAASDLIVLDHPGRVADELLSLLAGWLRRGRSALYVASEPADATNLKRLADLAGTDLRLPVEFAPAPPGASGGPRFVGDARGEAPPFRVFGESLTPALAPLRFAGALVSRDLPDALADDVRARYGDRSAFLVVSACGAGNLAVLNADLGASNFPASPAFVPLIGELSTLLLGGKSVDPPVAPGEPFSLPLPGDAGPPRGLKIVPGGNGLELAEEREGLLVRTAAAGPPGVTRVVKDDRTVFAVAAAVPEQESDLTPLPPSVFRRRLVGDRSVSYRDANRPDDESDTLWAWLAAACVVCLAVEPILLRAFRT